MGNCEHHKRATNNALSLRLLLSADCTSGLPTSEASIDLSAHRLRQVNQRPCEDWGQQDGQATGSAGRWTLTAGFGVAGQHRLAGNTHNNNIWRVIAGVEYWLARERFHISGPHKNISQALVPETGKTGAGQWYTLTWQELMMIAGDVWDKNDQQADTRARKRFQRVRDTLIKARLSSQRAEHTGGCWRYR